MNIAKEIRSTVVKINFFFELKSYGVCTWVARKTGMNLSKVRLGFIYASFVTLGSPLLIYLPMAWILENKHMFKLQKRRSASIWEIYID
jgi:phage shock protein PspC (stress-responsive transcriptional regulator)